MAGPRTGLNAQLGMKAEVTWGTAVTVDTFIPLLSETLDQKIDRLESAGIIAGARILRSQQWAPGNITIAGDLQFELYDRSMGPLFQAIFGNLVTSGAGPFIHTFTPNDLQTKSLTVQIGRPDVSGTVQPFTYAGCKVNSFEIACAAGQIATCGVSLSGKSEVTGTALASASYTAGIAPMNFVASSLSVAGSTHKIRKMTLKGDNGLEDSRRFLGQQNIDEQLEASLRNFTGTLDSELIDLTDYNRFVNGSEAALVMTLAKGTSTAVITMNVRYDGDTPNVNGTGIVGQMLPFKCVGATTDAGAITCVLTNTDATP